MGFPTKVQLIKRRTSEQWYINFPSAIAQAMEFDRGETVEWIVEDKSMLVLRRQNTPPSPLKKKPHPDSSTTSRNSGAPAPDPPPSSASKPGPKPSP